VISEAVAVLFEWKNRFSRKVLGFDEIRSPARMHVKQVNHGRRNGKSLEPPTVDRPVASSSVSKTAADICAEDLVASGVL
jgi:hypothetical protein